MKERLLEVLELLDHEKEDLDQLCARRFVP